jgi:hypothetical protein
MVWKWNKIVIFFLNVCVTHVDAGQHGEAPEADGGESQGDQNPNPKADGDELTTFPLRSKLSTVNLKTNYISLMTAISILETNFHSVGKKQCMEGITNLAP